MTVFRELKKGDKIHFVHLVRSRGVCCKAEKRHLTACFRFFVGLGESLWHKIHSHSLRAS